MVTFGLGSVHVVLQQANKVASSIALSAQSHGFTLVPFGRLVLSSFRLDASHFSGRLYPLLVSEDRGGKPDLWLDMDVGYCKGRIHGGSSSSRPNAPQTWSSMGLLTPWLTAGRAALDVDVSL